jgi:segregation and condensation protein A
MAQTEDRLIRLQDHTVALDAFEGPLDLLLFLIRRQEVDIYDIPIERITRQYLEALRTMETLQLDLAGEFFVMAATLMHIKSRMLLPRNEQPVDGGDSDDGVGDGPDPRWELVQQLIEYRKFKEAAHQIESMADAAAGFVARIVADTTASADNRPLAPVDSMDVWNAFNLVLRRLSERITVGQIHDEVVTVADRMEAVMQRVRSGQAFLFTDLFTGVAPLTASFIIASFLAILELTRLRHLDLAQDAAFGDIVCTPASPSDGPQL